MMAAPDAACPFSRMLKLKLCAPSETFATSPMVTFEPSAFARSTMAANSAGVCNWPCTVSGMVTRWPSTAGESPRRPGASGLRILLRDGGRQLAHGDVVRHQLGRIDPDAHGPLGAEQLHLAHAGNAAQFFRHVARRV